MFRDLKKGATKGAQRICTYCTYFYENIPVNGLGYVRWADLKLSVGLLIFPLEYGICPLGSFNAPFFSLRSLKISSSFFTTSLRAVNPSINRAIKQGFRPL